MPAHLYLKRLFCFTYQTYFALQHGGVYLVAIGREFSGVPASYLYGTLLRKTWNMQRHVYVC